MGLETWYSLVRCCIGLFIFLFIFCLVFTIGTGGDVWGIIGFFVMCLGVGVIIFGGSGGDDFV